MFATTGKCVQCCKWINRWSGMSVTVIKSTRDEDLVEEGE